MKEQKYILTDIDGVCLDWQKQFEKFLQFHHPDKDPTADPTARRLTLEDEMNQFIGSAWQGFCEPLRDAVDILKKFKKEGYEVHGCTAMGFDPYAIALRKINLETYFPNVFDKLDTTQTGANLTKEDWLSQYRGKDCVWVEDKWINALAGASMGITTFLMKQPYNAHNNDDRIHKVDNWQQIHYYINNK
tara:strand:+ start:223 stop:789 length:567 start_codon:yes stop_codon:yes gene_type:complete